jgi:hypothetical protein
MKLSHGVGHALLVAFDGEEVVGPTFLDDDARRFRLGMHRIGGDPGPFEGGAAQKFLGGGDFVGIFGHRFAAQPAAALDGVGADDFQALAAEQLFAVHGDEVVGGIAPAQDVVLPGQQGGFELAGRHVGEHPEEG